jgi:hypothetical protein
MANFAGRLAAVFPDTVNVSKQLYAPGATDKGVGTLRVVNQSGQLQYFRYAITPDNTPPDDSNPSANWHIYDLVLDNAGPPFTEGIVVGKGQYLWVRATSTLVAFQLNGATTVDQ